MDGKRPTGLLDLVPILHVALVPQTAEKSQTARGNAGRTLSRKRSYIAVKICNANGGHKILGGGSIIDILKYL